MDPGLIQRLGIWPFKGVSPGLLRQVQAQSPSKHKVFDSELAQRSAHSLGCACILACYA